jgi:L-alanine-DL-glutamate epimerase-like enolase superfamily enzyme
VSAALPRVVQIDAFIVTLPRDVPYLGPLGPEDTTLSTGYLIRAGNRTLYPTVDRSVILKFTTENGLVGWGETYGIIAPRVVTTLIEEIFAPYVLGRTISSPSALWDDLYDLMRVRGYFGGFWCDTIAAIDIAMWDIYARSQNASLAHLLSPSPKTRIPAYISGLPRSQLAERVQLAREFAAQGYRAFKYAAAVSHQGIVNEMAALRDALGDDADLMVDLHWKFSATQAVSLIEALAPFKPRFVEAPVAPEDVTAQAYVARHASVPIALGEEWHSAYVARPRFEQRAMQIVQPEIARCGVSQFLQIAQLAAEHQVEVIPHATIGVGIFLAASLHVTATLPHAPMHEYQHSIFDRFLPLLQTDMNCSNGHYQVPTGIGLGVVPAPEIWKHAEHVFSGSI